MEEYVGGELKCVDETIAEKTGGLLAQMHNIAERNDVHVNYPVLFDPFTHNDLFSFVKFEAIAKGLSGDDLALHREIVKKYNAHMTLLEPLRKETRYAVQGDISNCNLYQQSDGTLGIFDFNNCGDNSLFCDAVMQAVFEARLMDYPPEYADNCESIILSAFLRGYQKTRPFNETQKRLFHHLFAIIDAFWSRNIIWNDNSLINSYESHDFLAVHNILVEILQHISGPHGI